MYCRILLTIVSVLVLSIPSNAQTVVIIVNSENPVLDISSEDLRNIFIADKSVWEDGNSIQLVDWKINDSIREQFYAKIVRKSTAVVRRGWVQKIVIGNIYPPSVLSSEEEIVNYVATHRWAIAYVGKKAMPLTVKTITVDGLTADDPTYQLK